MNNVHALSGKSYIFSELADSTKVKALLLEQDHSIHVEKSTDSVILSIIHRAAPTERYSIHPIAAKRMAEWLTAMANAITTPVPGAEPPADPASSAATCPPPEQSSP